jgi:UPF0716 family protein affecting phage T7 exclusion
MSALVVIVIGIVVGLWMAVFLVVLGACWMAQHREGSVRRDVRTGGPRAPSPV